MSVTEFKQTHFCFGSDKSALTSTNAVNYGQRQAEVVQSARGGRALGSNIPFADPMAEQFRQEGKMSVAMATYTKLPLNARNDTKATSKDLRCKHTNRTG